MPHLDVVICTHNRSAELARVLSKLVAQEPVSSLSWSVLVVDNASSDGTAAVAKSHASELPLSYVHEPTLGLTHARQRGLAETTGEWIAYVDDDNLLEPGWIAAIGRAIESKPPAGGFGGRVLLQWTVAPPLAASDFGFCFAEQDLGDDPKEVESLVGAGMVLSRKALHECGWASGPMLDDRIGTRLISGGDVEMALRVRAAGYALHYVPTAVLQHRMPPSRATARYLLRINQSLGATSAVVSLLRWAGDYSSWQDDAQESDRRRMKQATDGLWWSLRSRQGLLAALAWLAFAVGQRQGISEVRRMSSERREALLGLAARGADHDCSALT